MHLAQLNIAKAKYALESENMADFVDNLEPVNHLADLSEGFIWRLQDETGDATQIKAFSDPKIILNMSVWASTDALKHFMFKTHHKSFLSRKKEWFHQLPEQSYVLWWIPTGHIPTVEEAVDKLMYLRKNGDTPYAFTFKSLFSSTEYETHKIETS
ncbi:DUF3291 domain-containing protein [Pseudoalteromonas sp. MMG012]|uniref:DUF3291 domain-containing protein n=1 Tax=Pseudoalteromonas sp. MMG012 TaxID=2822686 RepID=UPI001B3A3FC1|nr:DUF3291 domain-containing protein [Pseudoalteromonas sp. MMG012]MBQ4852372.1 DUF3291 domain-containing protein [Pseudoalteromonas sp. MMG012]